MNTKDLSALSLSCGDIEFPRHGWALRGHRKASNLIFCACRHKCLMHWESVYFHPLDPVRRRIVPLRRERPSTGCLPAIAGSNGRRAPGPKVYRAVLGGLLVALGMMRVVARTATTTRSFRSP